MIISFTPKCFSRYILITAFIGIAGPGHGQQVPDITTFNQQEAARFARESQYTPTMYGNHPPPYYSFGGPKSMANLSKKYEFTVVLKIDSTFTSKTSIDLSNEEEKDYHKIAVKRSKKDKQPQVYYPIDTRSITRLTEDGQKLVGIPVDSCWLFKTASGKINSYSFLAEPETPYVTAIQQGDYGPIVPLSKGNLLKMVVIEPKIQKLIDDGKLLKAIALYNKQ